MIQKKSKLYINCQGLAEDKEYERLAFLLAKCAKEQNRSKSNMLKTILKEYFKDYE